MGLFGGSTTYVASTLYNMAGEPLERSNYLKTAVIGSMILPGPNSVAKNVTNSYLVGPGMRLRSFFQWAETNYTGIGVPTGSLGGSNSVDAAVVQGEIPADVDQTITVSQVEKGIADFSTWVEQWLFENNPSAIGTEYEADIDGTTGEITITYVDTTTANFTPTDYDLNGVYIYAAYMISEPAEITDPPADPPDPPVVTGPFIYIYKLGSGNVVLDTLIVDEVDDGEYIPYIPIRLDNEFLSDSFHPDSYDLAKKAYKKVSRGNLDDIIEKLNDNEDLEEIDYAYLFFGVPLNMLDQSGRQYLYRFFDRLRLSQTNSNVEFLIWQAQQELGTISTAPTNLVHIKSNGVLNDNIDFKISWNTINLVTGSGLGKLGAIAGDYWLSETTVPYQSNVVEIFHQIDDDSWEKLVVIGAVHNNLIYNSKSVTITAVEALADLDESGFLVPIHYQTFKDMGLKDSTQLASQCSFLVLNSYQVVKKKWYQTGIFKIFVFVAIIAMTIAFPPLGGAALATYTAIGVAIGLTGLIAVIAGAIIYTLATMIIMKIIGKLSTEVFGERFGQIIAMVASLVVMQVGTGLANGASMSAMWGNMMSASNILNLTMAVGNGVSGYIQASAMGTMQKTEDLVEAYERESAELSQKFADQFGYDKALLDPLSLTGSTLGNPMETQAQFLSRTLMTGTDIAEMSKDMLNNMAEYTLSLDPSRGTGG